MAALDGRATQLIDLAKVNLTRQEPRRKSVFPALIAADLTDVPE